MKLVGRGRRGEIRLDTNSGIAIKKARDESKIPAINKEIQILLKLKKHNINFVPQIINRGKGRFSYYRINGITAYEIFKNPENFEKKFGFNLIELKKNILLNLLKKAYILDSIGVVHGEIMRPYKNIIINLNSKDLYIIDFERGKIGDYSGKNLKNYAQFLLNHGILTIDNIKKLGKLNIDEIFKNLENNINFYFHKKGIY